VAKKRRSSGKKNLNFGIFFRRLFANKLVLTGLICAIILGGIFSGLWHFFRNSEIFTIRDIAVNKEGDYPFWEDESRLNSLLLGRNIFTVNMKNMEMLIRESSPQLEKVEVRRVLPDRLEIDIVPRQPVAFIDSGGGFIIDHEAVVLAKGGSIKDLVEIKGIRFFFSAPSKGERIDNQMLRKALLLLESLRARGLTEGHHIKDIDISDRNNIQLGIRRIKVKMGNNDFSRKVDDLKEILEDPEIDVDDIKYIDLRFENAVISPE
jgi:cell division protein FtsQ